MKKSLSLEKIFLDIPFYDRFRLVREGGFDHLEFGAWTPHDRGRIRELLAQFNLKIACISGDKDYSIIAPEERTAFLEFLEESTEAALDLGCENLYIHSNALDETGRMSTAGADQSDFTKIAAATRALMEAAALAERKGVFLQLEPVSAYVKPGYFMRTTPSAGDIVRVVDSPHVRLLYDVYHMQMTEGDFAHTLRRYADVLGYVHIADVPDRHEPGTGEINFDFFKKVLFGELGYEGFVGFELSPQGSVEECFAALREF